MLEEDVYEIKDILNSGVYTGKIYMDTKNAYKIWERCIYGQAELSLIDYMKLMKWGLHEEFLLFAGMCIDRYAKEYNIFVCGPYIFYISNINEKVYIQIIGFCDDYVETILVAELKNNALYYTNDHYRTEKPIILNLHNISISHSKKVNFKYLQSPQNVIVSINNNQIVAPHLQIPFIYDKLLMFILESNRNITCGKKALSVEIIKIIANEFM